MLNDVHDNLIKDQRKMKGILMYLVSHLVSVDYIGSSFSAVVDCLSTTVVNKRFLKLIRMV